MSFHSPPHLILYKCEEKHKIFKFIVIFSHTKTEHNGTETSGKLSNFELEQKVTLFGENSTSSGNINEKDDNLHNE